MEGNAGAFFHAAGRLPRPLQWSIPGIVSVLVFLPALTVWFQADDFAWLAFIRRLGGFSSAPDGIFHTLFSPQAQGTIRAWSERLPFLLFDETWWLYRATVIAAHLANLGLISSITGRLTANSAAGFWAAILYGVSGVLAVPLSWNSAFNQILCAFCILLAFKFSLHYAETGKRRYYLAQAAAFLAGFGAQESVVMYPVLATAHALISKQRRWRDVVLLFIPSTAFVALHWSAVRAPEQGPYAFHFDRGLAQSLVEFSSWALGPELLARQAGIPAWLGTAGTAAVGVPFCWLLLHRIRQGDRQTVLFLSWFFIFLAPVLPLTGHRMPYYLTIPMVGLAMFGGAAIARARRPMLVSVALIPYLAASAPAGYLESAWYRDRSCECRDLVEGVRAAKRKAEMVLLHNVPDVTYRRCIFAGALVAMKLPGVHLTPDTTTITPDKDGEDIHALRQTTVNTISTLNNGRSVVLGFMDGNVVDITEYYRLEAQRTLVPRPSRRIDVVHPRHPNEIGTGWYDAEQAHRWMSVRSEARLAGPARAADRLRIAAFRDPPVKLQRLSVSADGIALGSQLLYRTGPIEISFALPAVLVGKEQIAISFELDRSHQATGDSRNLGLAVSSIEIRQD